MCSAYAQMDIWPEILRDFTLASKSLFDHFPVLKGKVSTLSWLMFIYRNLLYLISTACSCRPNLEDGAARIFHRQGNPLIVYAFKTRFMVLLSLWYESPVVVGLHFDNGCKILHGFLRSCQAGVFTIRDSTPTSLVRHLMRPRPRHLFTSLHQLICYLNCLFISHYSQTDHSTCAYGSFWFCSL